MPGVISASRSRSSVAVVPAVSFMGALSEASVSRWPMHKPAGTLRQGTSLLRPLRREHLEVAVLDQQPRHLPDQEVFGRIAFPDVDTRDKAALPVPNRFEDFHESVPGDLRRLLGHPA